MARCQFSVCLALGLALVGSAAVLLAAPVTPERLAQAAGEPDNWLAHGRDLDETRFSPLRDIHTGNVHELALAWHYDFPDTRGLEATPLVADGVMYVTGNSGYVDENDEYIDIAYQSAISIEYNTLSKKNATKKACQRI